MQKVKKIPQRQCVGCREMKDKRALIRAVKSPQKARARRLRLPEQRMPQAGAQIPRARARAGHGHPRERLRRNGKGDGKRWINCSI